MECRESALYCHALQDRGKESLQCRQSRVTRCWLPLKKRGDLEIDADTVSKLTRFLNSAHINWLYFSMLDVFFWPNGESKQYQEPEHGIPNGNIHLGDSGMLFYGKKKRHVFEVIKADLKVVFPGIDVIIGGGFGPKDWTEEVMKKGTPVWSSHQSPASPCLVRR